MVENKNMREINNRAFKGIWIPAHLWLTKGLTSDEKLLLVEIDSLDGEKGCYASNKYFGDFFGHQPAWAAKMIKKLAEKGYITLEYQKNEKNIDERTIRINHLMFDYGVNKQIVEKSQRESEKISEDKEVVPNGTGVVPNGTGVVPNGTGVVPNGNRGSSKWNTNNIYINNISNNTKNNILSLSNTSLQEESTSELSTNKSEREENKKSNQNHNSIPKPDPQDLETAKLAIAYLHKQINYVYGTQDKLTISSNELALLANAIHGKALDNLKDSVNTTVVNAKDSPVHYLITCIKNLPDELQREDM